MKYQSITYGQLLASWQLMHYSRVYDDLEVKTAIQTAQRSGKLGGSFPVNAGLRLCQSYNFLSIEDGILKLTDNSKNRIVVLCADEEPNTIVLREILALILSKHNFEWLVYYDSDPVIFKSYLENYDNEWVVMLENANLFDFEDEDVIDWWGRILSKYESYKDELKKAIGDIGENLTYQYERNRVECDGYIPSKNYVKWASQISDRYGFDVLSIRGSFLGNEISELEKIQIEVKSTDADNTSSFRFFISRPEWSKALENMDSYFFYCWSGISIKDESAMHGPFVIPAKSISRIIPTDVDSEKCSWSECRVVINLNDFCIALANPSPQNN
jgi:hypothetical protein